MKKPTLLAGIGFLLLIVIIALSNYAPETCTAPGLSEDQCWYEEATKSSKIALCDKITNKPLQESCVADVATATANFQGCDSLEGKPKAYCLATLTINQQGNCTPIEDGYWRDVCFQSIGMNTSNTALCGNVGTEHLRDICYDTISAQTGETAPCAFITDTATRAWCFTNIALAERDYTHCNDIEPNLNSDTCAMKVAVQEKDASICEKIGFQSIRARCFDRMAEMNVTQ